MRWRVVTYITGILLFAVGLSMLLPVACSLFYGEGDLSALVISALFTMVSGALAILVCRDSGFDNISKREGMAIVAVGWAVVGLYGALPFYISGVFPHFVDAFFESVSGFTTTGSSVLTNIEAVPRGLLLWRSLIQWLGGMGIIVLSLAILPFLGVGGDAALQSRGAESGSGQIETPSFRDRLSSVEGVCPHLSGGGGFAPFWRHGSL